MTLLSDAGIRADVEDAEAAVTEATGAPTRPWFRCPFGDGHDDPRVLDLLRDLGYRNVHWHVELEDWEPWRAAEDIARVRSTAPGVTETAPWSCSTRGRTGRRTRFR